MSKCYKRDAMIVVSVLMLVAVLYFINSLLVSSSDSVVIYVDNSEYGKYALNEPQTLTIDRGDGRVCVVEITDDGVFMRSSTCRNQLCVSMGKLTKERAQSSDLASWIVCLPNGVSVHLCCEEYE